MGQINWTLEKDRAWEVYKHMHYNPRFAGCSSGEEHAMKQAFYAGYKAGQNSLTIREENDASDNAV